MSYSVVANMEQKKRKYGIFYSTTTIKAKMHLLLPIKFVQFMDPIQFPFLPHNDGFNVFVLVQR